MSWATSPPSSSRGRLRAMSEQIFWFATRSAGILAWFAATASVVVGLMLSSRTLGRRPTFPWLTDFHRYFGAMSIVFLAIHLITLWADSFVDFGLAELLVPGRAEVAGLSELSLVLGVFAGWLLVIVEASSFIKSHLPRQWWHTLHLTSFGVVVMGAVHGIEAGSDTDNLYLVATATSVATAITMLTVVRLFGLLSDRKRRYVDGLTADDWDDDPFEDGDEYFDDVPLVANARLVDRPADRIYVGAQETAPSWFDDYGRESDR